MKVSLFYLAKPRFGGWITLTAHLAKSFRQQGHTVGLYQTAVKTESKPRLYGYGEMYFNLKPMDAFGIAGRSDLAIITAVDKSSVETADALMERGSAIVIHYPTEMKDPLLQYAKGCGRVVTIRKANVDNLAALGVR